MLKKSILCAVLALASETAVGGDVLYDALLRDITEQFPYEVGDSPFDIPLSFIGGVNIIGKSWDAQSADDFELTAAHTITSITVDRGSFLGTLLPTYMVEFFADVDGTPSEIAAASVVSSDWSAEPFNNPGQWGKGGSLGHRIFIDLADTDVTLDAGIWWVSVVSITDNDYRGGTFRQRERTTGGIVHYREAGLDHGNGFYPVYFAEPDWLPWGFLASVQLGGDIAMRIEGTPSSSCSADLTGEGDLNFFDVSAFLSAFASGDPAADFTGDGEFNFFDVSAFLSAFSAGCP